MVVHEMDVAMEKFHRVRMQRQLEKLCHEEINIASFTAPEIHFFAECNRLTEQGYTTLSKEFIDSYLTFRDERTRRYIGALHEDSRI